MYRLRQGVESRVALSKPVARCTGYLYLRIMYRLRQRIESRVALSKPVARCMGVDQIPITKKTSLPLLVPFLFAYFSYVFFSV
jgi:hypothetical protein